MFGTQHGCNFIRLICFLVFFGLLEELISIKFFVAEFISLKLFVISSLEVVFSKAGKPLSLTFGKMGFLLKIS